MWDDLELDASLIGGSIPIRVAQLVRDAIHRYDLQAGDRLPSSRRLAAALGVSRQSVVEAMDLLAGEGWVAMQPRSGANVAVGAGSPPPTDARSPGRLDDDEDVRVRPGATTRSAALETAWRRSLRLHAGVTHESDPLGEIELRRAVALHVRRTRGVPLDPSRLLITSGLVDSLTAICLGLGWRGDRVVIEDPCYPAARATLEALGCHLHGLGVDDDGLLVGQLPRRARAVLVTPSHQFPMGGRLPVSRRHRLIAWAREHDAVILEDDYDGEFRYGAPPLPALASLDDRSTVYLGTLSKLLDPGMRVSFVHLPDHLAPPVQHLRAKLGCPVPTTHQHAVGELFRDGSLGRHTTRVRRLYATRRAALIDGLRSVQGIRAIVGLQAGLHLTLLLDEGVRTPEIAARLERLGVVVADLDEFRLTPDPATPGIVLAYGQIEDARVGEVVRAFATSLSERTADGALASRSRPRARRAVQAPGAPTRSRPRPGRPRP